MREAPVTIGIIIAAFIAGTGAGVGAAVGLRGGKEARAAAEAAQAAASAAEAAASGAASAAEAAVAPQVEHEETVQAAIANEPERWLCDGKFADPAGCAWAICMRINASAPGATQAAGACGDLAEVYIDRLNRGLVGMDGYRCHEEEVCQ